MRDERLYAYRTRFRSCLALGFLVLGAALPDFIAWIALTNDVNATATTYYLAVGVTKFESSDGRYNFHGSKPSNFSNFQ